MVVEVKVEVELPSAKSGMAVELLVVVVGDRVEVNLRSGEFGMAVEISGAGNGFCGPRQKQILRSGNCVHQGRP